MNFLAKVEIIVKDSETFDVNIKNPGKVKATHLAGVLDLVKTRLQIESLYGLIPEKDKEDKDVS